MKKIILFTITIVLFILNIKVSFSMNVSCYSYYDFWFTENICDQFLKVAEIYSNGNLNYHFKYYKYDNVFNDNSDIIYLAGFGTPDGFWMDENGNQRINWCELTKLHTKILLIDSCVSGKIFECKNFNENIPIIITSTNNVSMSVNVLRYSDSAYISSFVYMLYCLFSENELEQCNKFIGCYGNNKDPQVCQLSIIFNRNNFKDSSFLFLLNYKDYHPNISIGTVMINGKPWRNF